MMHVTIDLGKRTSGIALWTHRRLVMALEVHDPGGDPEEMARGLYQVGNAHALEGAIWVAEKMLDYAAKGARAKDLESLRGISRCLRRLLSTRSRLHRLKIVPASMWKATTPKPICYGRILTHLDVIEKMAIHPRTKETLDAVGIGLWQTGRLARGMATPRSRRGTRRLRR